MWQGTTDDGCIALADLLGWKVGRKKLLNMVWHWLKNVKKRTFKNYRRFDRKSPMFISDGMKM